MGMSKTLAGSHLKCFVNGKLLGIVVGGQWDIDTPVQELPEIDSMLPGELAPTTYRVKGSVRVLRCRFTGGLEGLGIVAFGERMLRQKYFNIEMVDMASDDIVFQARYCMTTHQSWPIERGLIIGTFQFQGLSFGNEALA